LRTEIATGRPATRHAGSITPAVAIGGTMAVCCIMSTAAAQDSLEGRVGIGPAGNPDYEGSDEYHVVPFLAIDLRYRGFGVSLARSGVLIDISPSRFIDAGPVVSYRPERDDVEDGAVDALPDVDDAVEVGGFLAMNLPGPLEGRDGFTLRFAGTKDVNDGHDGYLVTSSFRYSAPVAENWRLTGTVSSVYASDSYMDSYFSVSPFGAAASGLRTFEADDGFKDVGLTLSVSYKVFEHWGITAAGRYTRLLGDAAESPVVDDRGDPDQFFFGIAGTYLF